MPSTILVPLDGSQFAEHALVYADRLAEAISARLLLIRVLPLHLLDRPETDLDTADEARTYLRGVAEQLMRKGLKVETATPWNDPSSGILDQVRASHAELIVMATHGRSGPGRWLYGSVADEVVPPRLFGDNEDAFLFVFEWVVEDLLGDGWIVGEVFGARFAHQNFQLLAPPLVFA